MSNKYLDINGAKQLAQGIVDKVKGDNGINPFDNMPVNTILSSRSGNIYGDKWCTYGDEVNLNDASPNFVNGFKCTNPTSYSNSTFIVSTSNIVRSPSSSNELIFFGYVCYNGGSKGLYTRWNNGYCNYNVNLASYANNSDGLKYLCLFKNYIYFFDFYNKRLCRFPSNSTTVEIVTCAASLNQGNVFMGTDGNKLFIINSGKTYYSTDGVTFSSINNNISKFDGSYNSVNFRMFYCNDGCLHFAGIHSGYKLIWYKLDPDTYNITQLDISDDHWYVTSGGYYEVKLIQYSPEIGKYVIAIKDSGSSELYTRLYITDFETGLINVYGAKMGQVECYKGNIIFSYYNSTLPSGYSGYYKIKSFRLHPEGYYPETMDVLTEGYQGNCGKFYINETTNNLYTLTDGWNEITSSSGYYSFKCSFYATSPSDSIYEYVKYK